MCCLVKLFSLTTRVWRASEHMVRNLGCFRLLCDAAITKVILGFCYLTTVKKYSDLRGVVALLVAERKCLLEPGCCPKSSGG